VKLDRQSRLWLGISLLCTCYYGICFYYFVFNQEYIVQDDARQHIVWLQSFVDPDLFPNDLIAEYFSGLAPLGFKCLFLLAAKLGIEPILFAKLLPPILAIVTVIYIYLFTLKILPMPIAGFISSLLLNQLIWLNDDLVSSTARAFIYPLFAAFLYYLAIEAILPSLIIMLLQGLFYPHIVLIEIVILSLRLLNLSGSFLVKLTTSKQPYLWWLAGLIVTAISLYPITQKPPELATAVSALQMQQMPEFNLGGRTPYFGRNWFIYWLSGSSGLSLSLFPTIVWTGLTLPWMLTRRTRIVKLVTHKIAILAQVIIASLIMFSLAHILLPELHLPSRYTYHTLRFILAISSGIVITIWLDAGKRWLQSKRRFKLIEKAKLALVTFFILTAIIFPAIPSVFINWFQGWRIGTAPEIYQYLAQQPKDIIVASLSQEVNNIPAFSQRSILMGDEFAMAYHPVYYEGVKQRTVGLLQAQYTTDLQILQSFIQQYGVDYLLIDKAAFSSAYLLDKKWLVNSSFSETTKEAIAFLESDRISVLEQFVTSCSVVSTESLNLLETSCIGNQL